METVLVVFLLAVVALVAVYIYYDRYKKDKKGKDSRAYIEGLKALLNGRDELAFSKFRDVISEDSTNIDAYIRIGNILRKYGKADKALQVHKDLTLREGCTREEKTSILEALAEDFIIQEDYNSALAALKELMAQDENNRNAVEKLLEVYSSLGYWEEAYNTKMILIRMDGDKSKSGLAIFKYFQGEKLFTEKKYHKARILFKEAIDIEKTSIPSYIRIGDAYVAENRLKDAVNIWKKMLQAVPDEAHLVLGKLKKVLFDLGRFGEISDICKDILDTSSKNLDARLTLAEYYNKKGEYPRAVEHLNKAADNYPDSYLPIFDLAKVYLVTDEKKKLGELLDKLDNRREVYEYEYQCKRCNHKSKSKIWLCPSCKAIDSFVR